MIKLTFIGNGNMAQAILSGLINSKYKLEVFGRDINKLTILKDKMPQIIISLLDDNLDITNKNIIFVVKPNNLKEVGLKLKGKANSLYSILAGTTIQSLKDNISSKYYVRVMPNISAKYNKSMTTLTGDKNLKNEAINIFNFIGKTLWVESQNELDIATAVAGSGPAFLAYFANAIIQGGIEAGLKEDDSKILTSALFDGFVPLLQNDKPNDIIKKVMSPNGTTEAGYNYLLKNNVQKKISSTITIAYNRALELAKS
jgi:pyrroline-5-carboxylate reductase